MGFTKTIVLTTALLLINSVVLSQTIGASLPKPIKKNEQFLFYLHGGVVTALGNNAINQSRPEWGPYEYLNILDSLKHRGFNVISENRKPDVDDIVYARKIADQVDSLFSAGVAPQQILILGASAGWNIALQVADLKRNKSMRYVVMGGCWPDTHKDYVKMMFPGHFLSVIESSDPHGTCQRVFEVRQELSSFREITLNTGLSHGFIYKGHRAWIDPIVAWFNSLN